MRIHTSTYAYSLIAQRKVVVVVVVVVVIVVLVVVMVVVAFQGGVDASMDKHYSGHSPIETVSFYPIFFHFLQFTGEG